MAERKPWWEDIKDRFNNLDQRELLLQKDVARLAEKVDWLIKLREEGKTKKLQEEIQKRWKLGIIVGIAVSLINLILNSLGVMPK